MAILMLGVASSGSAASQPSADLKRAVVKTYARLVSRRYAETLEQAEAMRASIRAFLAQPTAESLEAARAAWVKARQAYGRTEVFRFYGGPIDSRNGGVEPLVNAWPLDESYIDAVEGEPQAGIINHPEKYPTIDKSVLAILNQRGGETQVATGWHAIEFLLWGQDRNETSAGTRPYTDYIEGQGANAARRAAYLREITDLLLTHLTGLRDAWVSAPAGGSGNPEGGYRAKFESADPDESLRSILTGMAVLSGYELGGERMTVPYETRDQEEEHSCFSDTTHLDFIANMGGIDDIYRGASGSSDDAGIRELARAADPKLADRLDAAINASVKAIASIRPPFDRAIRAEDGSPERRSVLASIEALEAQTSLLSELAAALGYRIPTEPAK